MNAIARADDEKILQLFREWMATERATVALPGGADIPYPCPTADDVDPVLGLIAESDRLEGLAIPIRERADKLWFAIRGDVKNIEKESTAAAPIYREAEALEAERDRVFDQVVATKATTIAGVIAQIEFLFPAPDECAEIITAGLREISAEAERVRHQIAAGSAQPALTAQSAPGIVGFGEPERRP